MSPEKLGAFTHGDPKSENSEPKSVEPDPKS